MFCCAQGQSAVIGLSTFSPPAVGEGLAAYTVPSHHSNLPPEHQKPNVIVLLTDDQGWGDLSCHGNGNLTTCNLDSLSRSGARFEGFFVCPVCSPTRAEFLTGRFHPRSGVTGVSLGKERLDLDERIIAQDFKAAGYATACIGKWHNGSQYPYHPIARGFDQFYGFCSGHWGDYFSPLLDQNGTPVRGNGYIVNDLTDHALEFIDSNAKDRFFLYLPFPTPHSPMQVPDSNWQRFQDRTLHLLGSNEQKEDIAFTRAALAMVENIDENVGRIMTRLDELGISQNTIVVFFSDNGPNNDRWNGEMKGRKGSTDEGGVRSPLVIRWPAKIKPERSITQICSTIDLYPTLLELAGIPTGNSKPLDGISLTPLLTGQKGSLPDRCVVSHWNGQISIRSQQYRLDNQGRLYDMIADPGQRHDLAEQFPKLVSELQGKKSAWEAEVLSESKKADVRPFPVGHPDFHFTQLPARDGIPHGSVRRSSAAPNCSYFTGWTSPDDSITWNIEVLTAGRYEAEVHYACSESFVGSEIRLKFQQSYILGSIKHSNDPPLMGAENDRVPRTSESYVKDFQPMRLGIIELAQGVGTLELTAPKIRGNFNPSSDSALRELASEQTNAVPSDGIKSNHSAGIEVSMLTLRRVP